MSKPPIEGPFICPNDRFDPDGRSIYTSVVDFQKMCVAAFGQAAILRYRGETWVDERGTVTLAPIYLHDYDSSKVIRRATPEEYIESLDAAKRDGGRGVITVDGRSCYVD